MSNGTETLTLTDFLLARIAEDEGVARAVPDVEPPSRAPIWTTTMQRHLGQDRGPRGSVEMQPARVLAECEARRRIVEWHTGTEWGANAGDDYPWMCDHCRDQLWPCPTLRTLAAVYADHPDFREDWRP